MGIPINNLKQTCEVCPSQWEFTTFENRPVYVRYRWGFLSVCIGDIDGDIFVGGYCIVGKQLGDKLDGFITWEEVEKHIKEVTLKDKIDE
jgi:hypothetical protein